MDNDLKEKLDRARRDFERTVERRKEALKNELKSNAEFQRRSSMSPDDRARDARDRLAKGIKEFNDAKSGTDTTYSDAEKKANEVANLSDRQKSERGGR